MSNDPDTRNSRQVAAKILAQWLRTGDFPDRLIGPTIRDRAFVMEVVYGVARWRRALEWLARRCSTRAPDNDLLPYLLVGLYQLLLMDHVAPHAAVHETVEALKPATARAAGYVNGILRRVAREKEALMAELRSQSLGIAESHPDVLVHRWTERFGEEGTRDLCRWNNTRPEVIIRINTERTVVADFRRLLEAGGCQAQPHPRAPESCLVLPHGTSVPDLPGYPDGLFSVQDVSTLAAVDLLNPQPGDRILDACAAPGGKAVLMAERLRGDGELTAMDLHADRLERLTENLARLRFPAVKIVQGDVTDAEVRRLVGEQAFDRILLDVPCTNTGVLRRRPDARWRFSLARLKQLITVQREALCSAARLLKPGGILVYSTCSLEAEEGPDLVGPWLNDHPDFKLSGDVSLFPPESQSDGIYAAALQRELTATG